MQREDASIVSFGVPDLRSGPFGAEAMGYVASYVMLILGYYRWPSPFEHSTSSMSISMRGVAFLLAKLWKLV